MATDYRTPGVYVEEKSLLPPSVSGVATAIPAFIGITEKKTNKAVQKVTSLLEFQSLFGGAKPLTVDSSTKKLQGQNYVFYDSMRLYFDNGGGTCYVASAGLYDDFEGTTKPTQTNYIDALSQVAQQSDVTLIVMPDAAMLLDLNGLADVHKQALIQCANLVGRFSILDVWQNLNKEYNSPTDRIDTEVENYRNQLNDNLCYGAAYYPYLKSSYPKDVPFKEVIKALGAQVDEAGAASNDGDTQKGKKEGPEITADSSQADVLKRAAWIAALDDEEPQKKMWMNAIIPQIENYAETLEELQDEASVIPPSGALAGLYVATDHRVGVWQAPANIGIAGVKDLNTHINDSQQASMNDDPASSKSVNAIRFIKGKGILVWGSRTLDGGSNEWRFIPVRRLFSYVEQSVKLATAWAVFQPNDSHTWIKIKCQISNFLSDLWRSGALAGASPDESYCVEVGKDITMTTNDINRGYLRVRIGLAAVRPAEFIILEFSHKVQE